MTAEADAMLTDDKVEAFKFENHGDTVTGTILSTNSVQQRDYKTNTPKVWESGEPMMQLVFTLQTELRNKNNPDDDGRRTVWAKFKMKESIKAAVARARLRPPFDGCVLTVTYTGDDTPAARGMNGAKLFSAEIVAADYDPGTEPF